jgi:hypothetical protein
MSSQGPIDPMREVLAETQRILTAQTQQVLATINVLQRDISPLTAEIAALKAGLVKVEASQQHDSQKILNQSQQVLTAIADLPQKPLTINPASLVDLKTNVARLEPKIDNVKTDLEGLSTRHQTDFDSIRTQIREQKESKLSKFGSWVIPVLLTAAAGFFVWFMQISTNQRIDEASKKLATRLSVTEAFQKKKLSVYEEANTRMVMLMGNLEDLRLNPNDFTQKTAAFDNVRKLTDMSKNSFYMTDDVAKGLSDLAFTIATSRPLNGQPGNNLKAVTDMVQRVEAQMKKEFHAFEVSVRSDHLENRLKAGDALSRDRCKRVREEIDGEFQNGSGGRSIGEWNGCGGVEATTTECRRASGSSGRDAGSGSIGSTSSASAWS